MITIYSVDNQLKIEDFIFPYGKLDKNNRWVKLAEIIPWDKFEEAYIEKFVINNGRPAKSLRIALGSLIIKQKLDRSDRETVAAIAENPYLQYFIGLKEFQNSAPFGASTMVEFRKNISADMIIKMNEHMITDVPTEKESTCNKDDENNTNIDNDSATNKGTIIIDDTCTPADITYPQDLNLLNSARQKLEGYIDCLHKDSEVKNQGLIEKLHAKNF